MRRLEKTEGFGLFKSNLKKDVSTIVHSGRRMWWPRLDWPDTADTPSAQGEQYAVLATPRGTMPEGLSIMATPDRHGRPTLLSSQNLFQDPVVVPTDPDEPDAPILTPRIQRSTDDPTTLENTFSEITSPPLWLQSAIRMRVRFLRVAASSLPPGFPYKDVPTDADRQPPCCKCKRRHSRCIDEYYFWFLDSTFFSEKDAVQKANHDISQSDQTDPTASWDDPEKLPILLHWPEQPMLHLFWTRLHMGVLGPPRRSDEGIELRAPDGKQQSPSDVHFKFTGRVVDSLFFSASDAGDLGFRYDMPTHSAIVLPQVVPDEPPAAHPLEKSLTAYPYFVYFDPGASLEPIDSRNVALAMAGHLK